jgi:hypothetical protein
MDQGRRKVLAQAAGVVRHRVLRVVVALVVVAYPFWANPSRVNADPAGWSPKFSLTFNDEKKFAAQCSKSGDAKLNNSFLTVGEGGGVVCPGSTQRYGRYDFDALAPPGTTARFELRGAGSVSSLQLLTDNGVEVVRLVDGDDGKTRDFPFIYSDKIHSYRVDWAPSGLGVYVEGCQRMLDPKVTSAPRTFGIATTGPASLRVSALLVFSYGGGIADSIPADCGPSSSPGTVRHHGWTWWWIAGLGVAVVAVTLLVIALRRRDPRKLRPGHRK